MNRRKNGIAKGQIAIDKFIYACRAGSKATAVSQLFLSGEVDANASSEDGKHILTVAVLQLHLEAVRLILHHGGQTNRSSHVYYHRSHISPNIWSYNEPPLLSAARLDSIDMVRLLLEHGADINMRNECRPPQGVATFSDRTAVHFAAEKGNVELMRMLMERGADVNVPDMQGELPIHLASRCKNGSCENQRLIVELLFNHGSQINIANKIGCFPLYLAAFYGCVNKAGLLISYGADLDHCCDRDNSYVTALHIAACKDRFKLATILVENNAKLNIANTQGLTPLQLNIAAVSKSDIAALLIYHGADLHVKDRLRLSLLGTLIRNLRIDCEILAEILVFAGYDLNDDLWLVDEHLQANWAGKNADDLDEDPFLDVPIPHGRVTRLCDWLRERQQNPRQLLEICRIAIRKYLGKKVTCGQSIVKRIAKLPLPKVIVEYLLLHDICDLKAKFMSI